MTNKYKAGQKVIVVKNYPYGSSAGYTKGQILTLDSQLNSAAIKPYWWIQNGLDIGIFEDCFEPLTKLHKVML